MNTTPTLMPITDYQKLSDAELIKEIDHLDTCQRQLAPAEYTRRKAVCGKIQSNRLDRKGIRQFQAAIDRRDGEIARLMTHE